MFARISSVVGISVLVMFVVAVLGCGSGAVSSPAMSHGEMGVCGSMFIDDFVVLQRDGGYLVVLALVLVQGLFLSNIMVNLLNFRIMLSGVPSRLIILEYEIAEKLNDVILKSFSAGTLQPKVY